MGRAVSPSSRCTRASEVESIDPCPAEDLSVNLLGSHVDAYQASGGETTVWEHFLKVLRRQGVPFSAVQFATLERRLELAKGVFPRSLSRQEEVVRLWPDRRKRYPTALPPAVLLRIRGSPSPRREAPRSVSRQRSSSREGRGPPPHVDPYDNDIELQPPGELSPPPWHAPAIAQARAAKRVANVRRGRSASPPCSASPARAHTPRSVRRGSVCGGTPRRQHSSAARSRRDVSVGRASTLTPRRASASPRRSAVDVSPYRECRGSLPVGCVVMAQGVRRMLPELEGVKGKVAGTVAADGRVAVHFPPPFHEMYVPLARLERCSDKDIDLDPKEPHKKVSQDARYVRVAAPPLPHGAPGDHESYHEAALLQPSMVRHLLRKAEQRTGYRSYAAAVEAWRLADLLQRDGVHDEAVLHARRAVDFFVDEGVAQGRDLLLGAVSTCAAALNDSGHPEEALDLMWNTVSQLDLASTDQDCDARIAHNLAVLFHVSGDPNTGELHARTALECCARLRGTDDPTTLLALSNLALMLHDQGCLPQAAVLASRASLTLSDGLTTSPVPYVASLQRTLFDIMGLAQGAEATYTALLEKQPTERSGITWRRTFLAGVAHGSPAARCGLHRFKGRRLVEVNGKSVTRVTEIRAAFDASSFLLLTFSRETSSSLQSETGSPTSSNRMYEE